MQLFDFQKYFFIEQGDITTYRLDAIVNAANTSLLGGGGVDGAIHKAAGLQLLQACRKLNGCNPGEARITSGYNLLASYVIHTPGPVYRDGKNNEAEVLANSYRNSLLLAKDYHLKSIAFPAISTGVYNYPKQQAAQIALETTMNFIVKNKYMLDVYFVLFDNENYQIYVDQLEKLKTGR